MREENNVEQLMTICCFHIVKEIRKKLVRTDIKNAVLAELSKDKGIMQNFRDIKNMLITIKIDDIPGKKLEFTSNDREDA